MNDLIDPEAKARLYRENAEKVYFEDFKKYIVKKICSDWKSNNYIANKIENTYFQLDYTIEDCYNRTGNRTLKFLNSGKEIHRYRHDDISYELKRVLDIN